MSDVEFFHTIRDSIQKRLVTCSNFGQRDGSELSIEFFNHTIYLIVWNRQIHVCQIQCHVGNRHTVNKCEQLVTNLVWSRLLDRRIFNIQHQLVELRKLIYEWHVRVYNFHSYVLNHNRVRTFAVESIPDHILHFGSISEVRACHA